MAKRSIAVLRDWSNRGDKETTAWKVCLRGPGGGTHYVLMSSPRLASNHRLQPALKKCAEAAAKALEPFIDGLPT